MSVIARPKKEDIVTAAGLSLFFVWLVVHVELFSFDMDGKPLFQIVSSSSISDILNFVVLFVLFVLYWKRRIVPSGSAYYIVIAATLVMGYVLGIVIGASVAPTGISSAVIVLHLFFTNVGMALFSLEWIRLFGTLGSRTTIGVLVMASALCALLLAIPTLSLLYTMPFAGLIFPLGSFFVLIREQGHRRVQRNWGKESELSIPYRLLITVFIADLSCGAVVVFASMGGAQDSTLFYCVGYAGTALILLVASLCLRFDFNNLIYRIAFIAMSIGCLLLAFSGAVTHDVGIYVHQIGYRFMLALVYTMSAWLIDRRMLSANWVFPLVTSMAFLGQFVGGACAEVGIALLEPDGGILVVGIAIALLLPISALYLLDIKNLRTGWGFNRPVDEPVTTDEYFETACSALAKRYSLTPREADVFILIAKGHSRSYIANKLVLSKETVKSYANKMYSKIGVHSREEVIEIVSQRMREIQEENPRIPQASGHSVI